MAANVEPSYRSDAFSGYDRVTIALHWTTAILVVLSYPTGFFADDLPRGPWRTGVWSIHLTLGFILLLVLIARLGWTARRAPVAPPTSSRWLNGAAKGMHHLLYLLLIVVVGLGVVNAFVRGYDMFGLFKLPQIGDREWRRPITLWHYRAATILMMVALLHAVAALAHHYIGRDNVLRRMLPGGAVR